MILVIMDKRSNRTISLPRKATQTWQPLHAQNAQRQ
jgi:hypothetical protein